MDNMLIVIVIAAFLGVLAVNVYFRVKVLKVYKRLRKNNVEFDASHMLSDKKLQEEVLPRYPQMKDDILTFVKLIRRSITIACILMALIITAGLILNR